MIRKCGFTVILNAHTTLVLDKPGAPRLMSDATAQVLILLCMYNL